MNWSSMEFMEMRCDRCNEPVQTVYLSEDLSAPNVQVIGTPWYCAQCMRQTGQQLDNRPRVQMFPYDRVRPFPVALLGLL
jgi:uncharacterized protein with PIN domain